MRAVVVYMVHSNKIVQVWVEEPGGATRYNHLMDGGTETEKFKGDLINNVKRNVGSYNGARVVEVRDPHELIKALGQPLSALDHIPESPLPDED